MQIPQVSAGVFQSFYANRQNYKENLQLSENKLQSTKKEKKEKTKKKIQINTITETINTIVRENQKKRRGKINVDTVKNK